MDIGSGAERLFSAGDCPVCFSSSVLLLKAHPSSVLFFFCPFCGIGWPDRPPSRRIDTRQPLADFAEPISLPTCEEAAATGLSFKEVRLEDWAPC